MKSRKVLPPFWSILALFLSFLVIAGCQPIAPQAAAPPAEEAVEANEEAAAEEEVASAAEEKPAEKITLKFWRYIEENPEEKALLLEYAKKYTEEVNPNVEVEVSFIPWDQYGGEKLITSIAAGTGPDIFWVAPPGFIAMADNNIAYPLEDYIPEAVKKDFRKEALDAVTFNGHIIAVPNEQEIMALFYNKKLFDEQGLEPPKTWDEMVEIAKKLQTPDRWGIVIETKPDGYSAFTWYPFMWQGGGRVLNDDWTASEFDNPATIEALRLWGELVSTHKVAPPSIVDPGWYVDDLGQGKTAMQLNGTWAVSMLRSQYPDFEYGVVPYPIPEGGQVSSSYGGWTTMVNSRSPHIKEAVDFVMWLYASEDPTFMYRWSFEANFKWPTRMSVMEMAKEELDKWPLSVFRDEVAPYAKPESAFPPEVLQSIIDAMQKVMFDDATPEEAATQAAEEINDFLSTYEGSITASR